MTDGGPLPLRLGSRSCSRNDPGREGGPAQPVLLLRGPGGRRGRDTAAARRGRGGAGPRRVRVAALPDRSGRDQPAAAAGRRGQPARHPAAVRLRRHPRAADRSCRCRSPWRRPGTRRPSSAARRSPPARRGPSASTGPSRRWSTSPATRAGAASSRVPARTPTSVRPWPRPRCAASRASAIGTPERVIAGPKHFAGYGAALGGRDYDEVNLSDYELWNVYFPPFQAALAAGAGNVMTAYMDLNGVPASGNRWLFTEVLREHVGLRRVRGQRRQRGPQPGDPRLRRRPGRCGRPRASASGVDLEMAMTDPAYSHLPEAVERGAVERGGHRRLRPAGPDGQAAAGPVRGPVRRRGPGPARCWPTRPTARWRGSRRSGPRCCCATRATCCRSIPAALGSVAVIGPLADSRRDTLGPWVFDFDLDETVTVLDGLREPARRGDRGPATPRASGRPSGCSRRCSTCSRATRPRTRRTSTTRPSCSGRSTWPGTATWPWWCSASGSR